YYNCTLINLILGTKNREVDISKSSFTDTVIKVGNINTPGFTATILLEECQLITNTISYLFATDLNQPTGLIKLERCNIEINNSNFSRLINHEKTVVRDVLIFFVKESNFKYNGSTSLNLIYYNNLNPMIQFISSDNVFTNINLPGEDMGTFVGYDIDDTYKTNVTLQPNGDGFYATIVHNLNTLEPYVLCTSQTSQILQTQITILDKNSVSIREQQVTNLIVIVKKI
ncbi:hypothetical protein V7266_28455, partial [Neobacillus drentensis]